MQKGIFIKHIKTCLKYAKKGEQYVNVIKLRRQKSNQREVMIIILQLSLLPFCFDIFEHAKKTDCLSALINVYFYVIKLLYIGSLPRPEV